MALDPEDSKKINDLNIQLARLQEKLSTLETHVTLLVNRDEFTPVKLIAYGLACAVLSSVIMAVLAKVIIK